MNQVWQDLEKQEIQAHDLTQQLRIGSGTIAAWCHVQTSEPKLQYKLRGGVCFLRSNASWRSEDGTTEITVPAFHSGDTVFHQVGLILAITDDQDDTLSSIRLEVLNPYVGKVLTALRADILEARLTHF